MLKLQTLTKPSYQKSFKSEIVNRNINNTQFGMMASYNIMNGNSYQSFMELNSNDTISSLNKQLSIKLIGVKQLKPNPNANMTSIFMQ